MKKRFNNFLEENRAFVLFYLVWFLVQMTIMFINWGEGNVKEFWPFENFDLRVYDYTEFVFYMITPVIIFFIWKLIGKGENKRK